MVLEYSSAFTTQRLQPPPILNARNEPKSKEDYNALTIKVDSILQGLLPSNNKMVFTDISLGQSRRDRLIIIREPSGLLRHATPCERDRTNQIYFPFSSRSLRIPTMFEGQHLKNMLDRDQFVYLLDRACSQFEPDDPKFIMVCNAVYDRVAQLAWTPFVPNLEDADNVMQQTNVQSNPLRALRHTRFYAPLALYMIAHLDQPGALLYEAITSQHYARVGWLLRLCSLVRPQSKFSIALAKFPHKLPEEVVAVSGKNSLDHEMELSVTGVGDVLASLERSPGWMLGSNLKFYVSLGYNYFLHRVSGRAWYSRVTECILVGALPLRSMWSDLQRKEGITHVLSMLEPFEMKSFVIGPVEAESLNLKYLSLPVRDFVSCPTKDQINSGIAFIKSCTGKNSSVYVHCKAGRTRSAFLVACYLMDCQGLTPDAAIGRLRSVRSHVRFSRTQLDALHCFHASLGST